jgi:hypothetical protein
VRKPQDGAAALEGLGPISRAAPGRKCRRFMRRAEFTQSVRRLVAERSGHRCSYPSCPRTTIGPGASAREVSNTGVAAHIYSAAPQGPRGQGALPQTDITDPHNAIWLCSHHARLVDNNRGAQFPAALLREYKNLHEARIAREQRGIHAPLGWFHQLRIRKGPLFSTPTKLEFGKTTIIAGENDTGKTALWQWAAALGDIKHLERWRTRHGSNEALQYEVAYFDPEQRNVGVHVEEEEIYYTVEGQSVPLQPYAVRFIVPRDPSRIRNWRKLDDLERLTEIFDLTPFTVKKLLEITPFGSRWVKSVTLVEENGRHRAAVSLVGKSLDLNLGQISSSELAEVIMSIAVSFGSFSAQYVPTVFVLDGSMAASLDGDSLLAAVERLAAPDINFQAMLIVPARKTDYGPLALAGGTVIWLGGTIPNVTIGRDRPKEGLRKSKPFSLL